MGSISRSHGELPRASHGDLRPCALEGVGIAVQHRPDLLVQEPLHLLGAAADVGGGVQMAENLLPAQAKGRVSGDALQQVVVLPLPFTRWPAARAWVRMRSWRA